MILWLYRVLGCLAVLPLSLYVRRHPNFAGTLRRRLSFSLPQVPDGRDLIWFHAASVGEVRAIAGLIDTLRRAHPDACFLLTSMTATGRKVASSLKALDLVEPLPFDLPLVMRRYLECLNPRLLVIAETEVWPNMILAARCKGVPVVFVNARMTEKTFRGYRRVRPLMALVFKEAHVLAMASDDARRFAGLGALRVEVAGNLKVDASPPIDPEARTALREVLGGGQRPVFVAGSVREGEEEAVIAALLEARRRVPGLLCVLAPRHPERIGLIQNLAREAGLSWGLRSCPRSGEDLVIVDTVGELFTLYGTADVAFVGGSLLPLGGQNILEPVSWGVPTLHGPHMDNFTWALAAVDNATLTVVDAAELGAKVAEVLERPADFAALACEARQALQSSRGVTEHYAAAIECLLA